MASGRSSEAFVAPQVLGWLFVDQSCDGAVHGLEGGIQIVIGDLRVRLAHANFETLTSGSRRAQAMKVTAPV